MRNLSFKTKLLGLCASLALVSIVIAAFSFRGLGHVEESYEDVASIAMPSLNSLNKMFLAYRKIRVNLRSLGLSGLSQEQANTYVKGVHEAIEDYEKDDKEYQSLTFIPGQKELYGQVNEAWLHFKGIGVRGLELYASGTVESKEQLNKIFLYDCPEAAKVYTKAIEALKEFHSKDASAKVMEARETGHRTNQMIIIISLCGILMGLTLGFVFATKVSNSISQVARQLAANADQVSEASAQIASSSQELSQASTEQASSLEETAASLEQITAMIAKASDSAEATATSSSESHKKAEEGRSGVDQMLNSMDEISQSNEAILTQIAESNRQMTDIVKVIQEIGSKTKVINEIVFQTKLLSFNASVEAARAGEHGKGFAVVAEEVGNLAQMSGNAAKEITELLDGSISRVEKIVEDTKSKVESLAQKGKEKVELGVVVAKQCSDLLNEIVQNVSRVSGLSQEISQANKEQAQGVSEINKAMSQLDTVTQQNAATSEETASAAEELSAQSESLKASVVELAAVISGGKQVEMASAPPTNNQAKKSAGNTPKKKSNLVHLKAKKESRQNEPQAATMKMASGDHSSIPSRDDDGFRDV